MLRSLLAAALFSAGALTVADFLFLLVHESGHALLAWILGGAIPLIHLHPLGGRVLVYFPSQAPVWKMGATVVAGPLMGLVAGIAVMRARPLENRLSPLGLVVSFAGIVSGFGTMISSFPAPGNSELLSGIRQFGLPLWSALAVGTLVFSLGVLVVLALVQDLVGCLRSLWQSMGAHKPPVFAALVGIPVASLVALNFGMAWMAGDPRLRAWFAGAGAVGLLAFTFRVVRAHRAAPGPLPSVPLEHLAAHGKWGFVAIAGIFATYSLVFGLDEGDPKGIFIEDIPREVSVSACNIVVDVLESSRTRILFAMRPFALQHEFLWTRVRSREPADWSAYDSFALTNTPRLLPLRNVRVVSHRIDASGDFFAGNSILQGARLVEVEAILAPAIDSDGHRILTLQDFWKTGGRGILDRVTFRSMPFQIAAVRPFRNPSVRANLDTVTWVNGVGGDPLNAIEIILRDRTR